MHWGFEEKTPTIMRIPICVFRMLKMYLYRDDDAGRLTLITIQKNFEANVFNGIDFYVIPENQQITEETEQVVEGNYLVASLKFL